MKTSAYCAISATLFSVVALAHFTRILNGWPASVGSVDIPMALSWFGVIGPGTLAILGFRAAFGNRS